MRGMAKPNSKSLSVAVLAFEVGNGTEFRLFPAGEFRARDGRPGNVPAWRMDATIAAALIRQLETQGVDLVIDYEHQTLLTEKNGLPAPASGWVKHGTPCGFEWREGDGLYVVNPEWTGRAKGYIDANEYRYISPVFLYDKTGAVTKVLHIALTNDPALDEQPGITDAVAAKFSASLSFNPQENTVNEELLEQLRWLLNLPVGATAEEVIAQLQKLIDQLKAGPAQAAASFDLVKYLNDQGTQIAALKSATPNPAEYVGIAVLKATQDELATSRSDLAALRQQIAGNELEGVVSAALAAGKLLPAQEAWARDLGSKDLAALKGFIDTALVVAPVESQTGGTPPAGDAKELTESQLAICKQLSVSPEDYAKTLAAENAA